MDPVRLPYLLQQFDANLLTEAEREELTGILFTESREEVVDVLLTNATSTSPLTELDPELFQPLLDTILQRKQKAPIVKMRWLKWVAAAVLLVAAAGIWWSNQSRKPKTEIVQASHNKDIPAPSGSHAAITLTNGQQVYLDSVADGLLTMQAGVNVIKQADGKIVYQGQELTANSQHPSYNTLSNPRGSKVIDITLADGSHVWLNAGSSLTYPVSFIGNERKVAVTGEAYFEVAHDAAKPFIVSKGDMSVQVLGTRFNVNAYDDEEEIKVTLLEGSVKVKSESPIQGTSSEKVEKSKNNEVIIKPGEQASISEIRDPIRVIRAIHIIRDINVDEVIAWKNGLFSMHKSDIGAIMRQLARWYDVEVTYENGIPNGTISGDVPRHLSLSEVLKIYEYSGVHFVIEGKKIIVKQ